MAKNIADEITKAEADAKQMIQDARTEGARILAKAKTESEEQLKSAKQGFHRSFRETVAVLEKDAEAEAEKIIKTGRAAANDLVDRYNDRIPDVASWVAEEVIGRYGSKTS